MQASIRWERTIGSRRNSIFADREMCPHQCERALSTGHSCEHRQARKLHFWIQSLAAMASRGKQYLEYPSHHRLGSAKDIATDRVFQKAALKLLFAPNEFDACFAKYRDALVALVRSKDCRSVTSRRQVGSAIGPDVEFSHHVYIGPEAIPTIRIQELDRCATHDVDLRINQYERRGFCAFDVGGAASDAEHLYRRCHRLVSRICPEWMSAPGSKAAFNEAVDLFGGSNFSHQ